jgi:Intracellular proteinase inhibitor
MNKKWLSILFVTLLVIAGCGTGDEETFENANTTYEDQADLNEKENDKEETLSESEGKEMEQDGGSEDSNTEPSLENEGNIPSNEEKTPPRNDVDRPVSDLTIMTTDVSDKFQPSVEYKVKNGVVTFLFTVQNTTDHFYSMHFDTTQRFEYVITDKDNNVIKTYSSFATFEKMPGEEPLKPGGSLQYEVEVPDLPKGKYHITFILMAKEFQPKTGIDFEVK